MEPLELRDEVKKLKEASNAFQDAWIAKVEENKKLKEDLEKSEKQKMNFVRIGREYRQKNNNLTSENVKLNLFIKDSGDVRIKEIIQKANAWDIHNRGDWDMVSMIWDKGQCLDLIECGACKREDFEGHENFNQKEDY